MNNRAIVVVFAFALAFSDFLPADDSKLDLSTLVGEVEFGVVTTDSVRDLSQKGLELYKAGQHEQAIPVLDKWAKEANQLANLLAQTIEPFYDATSSQTSEYFERASRDAQNRLIGIENKANYYRGQRNLAMVLQADCHSILGNDKQAASIYYKALDLISINPEETETWERAQNGLLGLIGYEN